MKAIAIIPARYKATRFEGKILVNICGKPMIRWVYERTKKAKKLQEVVIATDDERIKNACLKFTDKVVMTSSSCLSGTQRVCEVAKKLSYSVIINVQGDEPLISPHIIDRLVEVFEKDKEIVMATAISKIKKRDDFFSPSVVKVVIDKYSNAIYFSRAGIPYLRNKSPDPSFGWVPILRMGTPPLYQHIGIYGYRKDFLIKFCQLPPSSLEQIEGLEQLRVLENGYKIKVIKCNYQGRGVDVPEDVKKIETYLSAHRRGTKQ